MVSQLSAEQIDKLVEDIQLISTSIRKNSGLIRQIVMPTAIRVTAFFAGGASIVLSLSYYIAARQYGGHTAVPVPLRIALYALTGLAVAGVGLVKNVYFLRSARKIDPGISYAQLLREFHAGWFPQHYLPTGIVMIVLLSVVIAGGEYRYIVPIISICYGLMINSFGVAMRIWQFTLIAYWLVAAGLVAYFTPGVSQLLSFSYSMGLGMLLLGMISGERTDDR